MTPKKTKVTKADKVANAAKAQVIKDNAKNINRAAFLIRAVQNADRQRILRYVISNNQSVVSELCSKLKVEQSIMSQHLAILRTAGLVKTERDGKYIFYSVVEKQFNKVMGLVGKLGES
ncbi:MAG TPA: metalloregulator ArsR/SmtB family transcription factor [Chitinophagales bacterium]|nr:metalloregulator ArsR/SmtB family transcription factor [Chitinophagales bacterium]HLP49537.1 metalloregulator ArsR/SmtB family transcription factor [Chitinophagales bacterium]